MVFSTPSPSTLFVVVVAALLGNIANAAEFDAPDWVITGSVFPPMTVNVGDSLKFEWSRGTHDVWIYPSGTCDNTGAILVGTVEDNPSTHVFGPETAGTTVTFACDVGLHCESGMIMDVTVMAAPETVPEVVEEEVAEEEVAVQDEIVVEEETTAGPFSSCNVCGSDNATVTEPEFILTLPGGQNSGPIRVNCSQLYQDGLNGLIPEASCQIISDRALVPCGCASEDFTCNICVEDDFIVRAPDEIVTIPTDPENPLTCADLSAAGMSGDISPAQCARTGVFAFVPCQCSAADFTCSICGEGFVSSTPEAEITVPGYGTFTCGQLEESGFAGELSPAQCIASETANFAPNTCGCIPEEGYPECLVCEEGTSPADPDAIITLSRFETSTCQTLYEAGLAGELIPNLCPMATRNCECGPADYTCNVCGGDGINVTMLNPEKNFTVPPNDALVNCGMLDDAGVDGTITRSDCAEISPLVQSFCGCAPTGFTCNICGGDSEQTITEVNATFVPGDNMTCSEAQASGLAGDIDPTRCTAITPFAQVSCGCQEVVTLAPVVEDVASEANASVVEDPVTADETEDATDTTATTVVDTTDADESVPDTTEETPVTVDEPTDVDSVTDPGTATSLEGSDSKSTSGSAAVPFKAAAAISFLMGFVVALFL